MEANVSTKKALQPGVWVFPKPPVRMLKWLRRYSRSHCLSNASDRVRLLWCMYLPYTVIILISIYMLICKFDNDWPSTHWGRAAHVCVSKLTVIGLNNSLSPGRHQYIIKSNDRILVIGPLRTNVGEILIESHKFWFEKIQFYISSAKQQSFGLGLNAFNHNDSCILYPYPNT